MNKRNHLISSLLNEVKQVSLYKFLLAGVINTLFAYFLFALFIYSGLHYVFACLLVTCIGIIFNYNTIGKIAFNKASTDRNLFFRFCMIYAGIYFLSLIILKVGTFYLQNIYLIGALGLPFTSITAYLLNKNYVFHRIDHETN